jgi:hypothetical protein
MSYLLGTTENKVRWYKFKFDKNLQPGDFELLTELDIGAVPIFNDKETAKAAAKSLGLKTWRYFSF